MRPLSVKKSESMVGGGKQRSLEFRLQAAPRYAEIHVGDGICLASTQSKATRGIIGMAQDPRASVAFTSASAQLGTPAISHFGGLL